MNKEIVEQHTILRGIVGSTAHGTAIQGQDDRDEMGIYINPPELELGLLGNEHYIFRTQPEGVRSGPGDLDLTMYSLKRFCSLAAAGNPSILLLLFLPDYLKNTYDGQNLIDIRKAFISKTAGKKYLGYLRAQRDRLLGVKARTVSRPDLVAKYGYDTKFAMHALRLGYQGIELLRYQTITLPAPPDQLEKLRAIREGIYPFELATFLINRADEELGIEVDKCTLEVDRDTINHYLVHTYLQYWVLDRWMTAIDDASLSLMVSPREHR